MPALDLNVPDNRSRNVPNLSISYRGWGVLRKGVEGTGRNAARVVDVVVGMAVGIQVGIRVDNSDAAEDAKGAKVAKDAKDAKGLRMFVASPVALWPPVGSLSGGHPDPSGRARAGASGP